MNNILNPQLKQKGADKGKRQEGKRGNNVNLYHLKNKQTYIVLSK